MLCNITQNSMRQTPMGGGTQPGPVGGGGGTLPGQDGGTLPGGTLLGGILLRVPCQGVPCWGVPCQGVPYLSTPQPGQEGGYPVRTTEGVLTTRRAVCLLRLRRRTFLFLMRFSHYFRNFLSVITDESGEQLLCGKAYRILTATEMVITFSSVADDQKGFLLLYEGSCAFFFILNMLNSYGSFVMREHSKGCL